ncbi:MAG: DUF2336 domain-containing protein [bacterium]|nr:DUF2336 domain-containing protein [bacterium]
MSSAQVCLADLEALSVEHDAGKRRELLRKVTDLFFITEEKQSEADRDIFGGVLERISFELEVEARAELSQRLSSTRFAPHNIVRRLAEDDIDVAKPVLERSTVLTDEDLVDIAYSKGQEQLMAISRREALSIAVTDVIVQRGNDEVLTNVSGNLGAVFSSKGFGMLAVKATDLPKLRENLIERDDVPNEIVEMIKSRVAAKLKKEFSDQHSDISSLEVDHVVELQSGNIDFSSVTEKTGVGMPQIDIQDLHKMGLLTQAKICEFAEKGLRPELVHSLAIKANIDVGMAFHTLYEAEVPALAVLCRAYHFKRETFGLLLQERVRASGLAAEHVVTAMKRYDSLDDEIAQRIFRFLKVRLSVASAK